MTDITENQYVLSSRQLNLAQMKEYPVGNHFLYLHPQLRHVQIQSKNGKQLWLLGHAYCMDVVGKEPAQDIANWDGENWGHLTRFWTGRWVLLTEDTLITDACGLMSGFYWQDAQSWQISSSLALLCQLTGIKTGTPVSETGLTWQLLPYTRASGIYLPLCTQSFHLGKELTLIPNLWMADYRFLSGEEKCAQVANFLVNGIKNMEQFSGKRLCVALTGGKDSRLVLAALLKAQVRFESYTAHHNNISSADRKIPMQLAKRFGFKHIYLRPSPIDKTLLNDYDHFTAGNSNGADKQFYAKKQFSQLNDVLLIRGGLFEAGQTYARGYTGNTPETFAQGMRRYYGALTSDPSQMKAFEDWLANTVKNHVPHVDVRDRFYLEQRVGGWVAAIEQSLDMNAFTSIQIANCAELLSVLLSADTNQRQQLTLSYGTIRYLEPTLLEYDINKRTPADQLVFARNVLKNPVRKLKSWLGKRRR